MYSEPYPFAQRQWVQISKKLIEDILIREANDMDDAEVYKYLASTRPEGKIMLLDAEQDEFERKMGIGKYR